MCQSLWEQGKLELLILQESLWLLLDTVKTTTISASSKAYTKPQIKEMTPVHCLMQEPGSLRRMAMKMDRTRAGSRATRLTVQTIKMKTTTMMTFRLLALLLWPSVHWPWNSSRNHTVTISVNTFSRKALSSTTSIVKEQSMLLYHQTG